jgi:hypothetical protein
VELGPCKGFSRPLFVLARFRRRTPHYDTLIHHAGRDPGSGIDAFEEILKGGRIMKESFDRDIIINKGLPPGLLEGGKNDNEIDVGASGSFISEPAQIAT